MKYGAVLRAQVHAEALGLNPLENGEEGVSQLPEKRLELLGKEKKGKMENAGSFIKGVQKAFPVRPYIFTFCRFTKNPYFSI